MRLDSSLQVRALVNHPPVYTRRPILVPFCGVGGFDFLLIRFAFNTTLCLDKSRCVFPFKI